MYNFVGRLKPGVTRAQAQDDLKRVLLQLKSTYPALWDQQESVRVLDLHDSLVGQVRPALEMLMGAVALVLVIVSANILSLLLTRSIARRREMSLRAALGAIRLAHPAAASGGECGALPSWWPPGCRIRRIRHTHAHAPEPAAAAAVRQPAHRRIGRCSSRPR